MFASAEWLSLGAVVTSRTQIKRYEIIIGKRQYTFEQNKLEEREVVFF